VYGVNTYGFTTVLLWFEVARDGITAAAHRGYGTPAAGVYKMGSQRQYVHAHGATNDR
jgi:hypothetical protein